MVEKKKETRHFKPRELGKLTRYVRNRPNGDGIDKRPLLDENGRVVGTSHNGGRHKGKPNRTTQILKDAILLAAEAVGEDGEGLDGLVGYLTMAAKQYPKNFMYLLGRVLPYQVAVHGGENLQGITQKMTPAEAVQIYVDTLHGLQQGLRTPNLILDMTANPPPPSHKQGNGHDDG